MKELELEFTKLVREYRKRYLGYGAYLHDTYTND